MKRVLGILGSPRRMGNCELIVKEISARLPEPVELSMVPKNTVKVEGGDAERILRLVEVLEELDDVSKVFSNFDIDAAQLAEAEA